MGQLSLGWARRDITPNRPVALRGQFHLRIATRVQDPLTLTALVLENGGESLAFVSVDNCAMDDEVIERVRAWLPERLPEFQAERLIASGTHTHTAPFASTRLGLQNDEEYLEQLQARYPNYMSAAEYRDFLAQALVEAVAEAWERRAPGYVGWGYSYAVVGENRRVRYFDNRAVMYGAVNTPDFSHIEGHVDHGVHLLFTYDQQQELTGMIINLACPSQASESAADYISADFWHDIRQEIRRRYGRDLHILAQCSAAGDQSPHRLIDRRAEDRMIRLKYGEERSTARNFGLRQEIARRVAYAVEDAEPIVRKDLRNQVFLGHRLLQLELPHWQISPIEYAKLQQELAEVEAQLDQLGAADPLDAHYTALRSRLAWLRRAASRYKNPPTSVPVEIHVARLEEIAFVTAPFEYYLDYGDRIKGRSPALQTFVIQLVGGGSYLPTERAAAGQSYGAIAPSCLVSPKGGQMIVEAAIAALQDLFPRGT